MSASNIIQALGITSRYTLLNSEKLKEVVALFVIFFTFAFGWVTSYLFWLQKFELKEGKIIDYFPRKKIFDVKDIESIILVNPKTAQLLLKRSGDNISQCVYWFGNSEAEWMSFLSELEKADKQVNNKLHFITSPKVGAKYKRASVEECYKGIEKVFFGVNKY